MQLQFNDVLIEPKFSMIRSRSDVSLTTDFLGLKLSTPIISSNMDTITGEKMAAAIGLYGALGALHRFTSIEGNVEMYEAAVFAMVNTDKSNKANTLNLPIVSLGVGEKELSRALALAEVGAKRFLIDVAHGASIQTVEMYDKLRSYLPENSYIIVGNFSNAESVKEFIRHAKSKKKPDAIKVGIGGGSMCTTRIVTGCGSPTLSSIIDCATLGIPIIADGGHSTSGDIAKSLAAGASVVMLGNMLAGTDETPGLIVDSSGENIIMSAYDPEKLFKDKVYKVYRGSASYDSYVVQGKVSNHRAPEGEKTLTPYKGTVTHIIDQINGGIKSALSYVGAQNLNEFKRNAQLVQVSQHGSKESTAHGKI